MLKHTVVSRYSDQKTAKKELEGKILLYSDAELLGISIQPRHDGAYYTQNGTLVALFLVDIFDEEEQAERTSAFSKVTGDLRNRPEIIGKGAKQQLDRADGTPSEYIGTPPELLINTGKASMYGFYRYKNTAPGQVNCDLTGPTRSNVDLYLRILDIERHITDIYRHFLPEQYTQQMQYLDSVMPAWKTEGSAFSTSYGLKNQPCAVHVDKFDIPSGTGVITTTGAFEGNELAMPEFGIAFDIQPSDILFLDVHRWHGNFPRIEGNRTSQVFFVRKGMHECR